MLWRRQDGVRPAAFAPSIPQEHYRLARLELVLWINCSTADESLGVCGDAEAGRQRPPDRGDRLAHEGRKIRIVRAVGDAAGSRWDHGHFSNEPVHGEDRPGQGDRKLLSPGGLYCWLDSVVNLAEEIFLHGRATAGPRFPATVLLKGLWFGLTKDFPAAAKAHPVGVGRCRSPSRFQPSCTSTLAMASRSRFRRPSSVILTADPLGKIRVVFRENVPSSCFSTSSFPLPLRIAARMLSTRGLM